MFCSDTETVKARKPHLCSWCGQHINPGETYKTWNSVDGDSWHTNKMHTECESAMQEETRMYGENEYTPYEHERPEPAKQGGVSHGL